MNSMWIPLQWSISIPWPGGRARRNIRPMPAPMKVRGLSSVSASTMPLPACTSFRSVAAISRRHRTLPAVEQKEFDSDGVRLAYYLEGPADGPPVLLVHGVCSNFQVNWDGSRWVETISLAG